MPYYTSNNLNPYIKPNTTNMNSNKDIYSLDVLASYTKFDLINGDSFNVSNYNILKKYELLLKSNTLKYRLQSEEKYRPELVSNNIYGTPNLWYLVLFVNDLERACKLDMDEIVVLPANKLSLLSQIYSAEKQKLDNKDNPSNGNDLSLTTFRYANIPKYKIKKRHKPIIFNSNIDENINNKNILSTLLNYDKIKRNNLFNYKENIKGWAKLNGQEQKIEDINSYTNLYKNNGESFKLSFKTISKKSEIISFKPCYIGKLRMIINGEEAINNSYSLPISFTESDMDTQVNKKSFNIYNYNDITSSLIFKISLNNIPSTNKIILESKIKYNRREVVFNNEFELNATSFYHYINIDDIYGDIENITITLKSDENLLIDSYKYQKVDYETYNISTEENDINEVDIEYNGTDRKLFNLLISKWFKNYRNLLPSDIILEKQEENELEIVNINDSRSYIAGKNNNINNDIEFKGSNFFDININSTSNDFSLYCMLGADSFKLNGSIGLFFKLNKQEKLSYLYTITKKYNNVEDDICYLNGLYKLHFKDTNYQNIKCDSNEYNVIKAELLSSNETHNITGNNNDLTSLRIITEKSNIKIYGNESNVLINYTDMDPIPKPKPPETEEEPDEKEYQYKHGIYIFNLSNPIIRDLTIHELKYI